MSLGIDKRQQSDALSEFLASEFVSRFLKTQMGAVHPPNFWKMSLESLRDPQHLQILLALRVEVGFHTRIIYGSNGEFWDEEVSGWVAADQEPLLDLYVTPQEQMNAAVEALKALFHRIGPRLYEYDPRIGFNPARKGTLPLCPLLDPHEMFSRSGVVSGLLQEHFPNTVHVDLMAGHDCPLCDEEIDGGRSFMWGGANIMWVHHECWRAA